MKVIFWDVDGVNGEDARALCYGYPGLDNYIRTNFYTGALTSELAQTTIKILSE